MSTEPCGSVPVTSVCVSAHYCHVHQAWTANAMTYVETGHDGPAVTLSEHLAFGPFDQWIDVHAWLVRHLGSSVTPPA